MSSISFKILFISVNLALLILSSPINFLTKSKILSLRIEDPLTILIGTISCSKVFFSNILFALKSTVYAPASTIKNFFPG